MRRENCWEVLSCGREPGGKKVGELGVCPAAVSGEYDGVNGGKSRGRVCWQVTGTLCEGEVQGNFAKKMIPCLNCKFLQRVQEEEGRDFILMPVSSKKKS